MTVSILTKFVLYNDLYPKATPINRNITGDSEAQNLEWNDQRSLMVQLPAPTLGQVSGIGWERYTSIEKPFPKPYVITVSWRLSTSIRWN
jgi:hypothetical protein